MLTTEAAAYLGTTLKTLASWWCTRKVRISYVKLGNKVLYRIDSLERFLDQHTVHGESNWERMPRVQAKIKTDNAA